MMRAEKITSLGMVTVVDCNGGEAQVVVTCTSGQDGGWFLRVVNVTCDGGMVEWNPKDWMVQEKAEEWLADVLDELDVSRTEEVIEKVFRD